MSDTFTGGLAAGELSPIVINLFERKTAGTPVTFTTGAMTGNTPQNVTVFEGRKFRRRAEPASAAKNYREVRVFFIFSSQILDFLHAQLPIK